MAWHCSMNTLTPAVHEVRVDFSAGLSAIIARLMRKVASERYVSAEALLSDLQGQRPTATATLAAAPLPATSSPAMLLPPPLPMVAAELPAAESAPASPPLRSTPLAPAVETQKYYVRLGGRTSGPFDLAALQQQARRGLLSRLHQVSSDRLTWQSAAAIEGLLRVGNQEPA
jgi:hypothetical protein